MLALCLMLLGTYYTLPIMLALCLMLLGTYYAQNYAGIIGRSLTTVSRHRKSLSMSCLNKRLYSSYAESNSKTAAARAFNIDRKCVQAWIKQKDEIIAMVGEVKCKNNKRKRLSKWRRTEAS